MKNKLMINSLLIILLLAPVNFKAYAYSEENHMIITQAAIHLLRKKYGYDYISLETERELVKGNVSEDKFGHKWVPRITNQHFYNPNKDEKLRKKYASINKRFDRIAKRQKRKINSKKYYCYVGELLHHIQDVTNPAHVVPVYHGPFYSIKQCTIKDAFDEQPLAHLIDFNTILDTKIDNTIKHNHKCILAPIAEKTLNAIHQKFEVKVIRNNSETIEMHDWSAFWEENKNDWFGEYGFLAKKNRYQKRDNYGKSKITIDDTTYIIDKNIYEEFSAQQINLAVLETVKFIEYAINLRNQ